MRRGYIVAVLPGERIVFLDRKVTQCMLVSPHRNIITRNPLREVFNLGVLQMFSLFSSLFSSIFLASSFLSASL